MSTSISKKINVAGPIFLLLLWQSAAADTQLVLYFTHLPQSEIATIKDEIKKDNSAGTTLGTNAATADTPGEFVTNQIEQTMKQFLTPKLSGFPLLYAGYTTITDANGLATFPLRHAQQKLYVAVTPDIKMIHVKGSSFSHTEYAPDMTVPLALYKLEKSEDEKKQALWKVSKIDKPDNNRINPITVVILTHPDNIFITEGSIMATPGEQMVIPPIRVVGNQDKDLVNLRLLDITPHFEKVQIKGKRANDNTVQKIVTTF